MILNELKLKYKSFGTPTYIFDIENLRYRISCIKKIVGDGVKICYAIKANPFVVKYIIDDVDKLEVCSPGELKICIENQILPDKIFYSGVIKGYDDIFGAINYGVNTLTAESKIQLELINTISASMNKTVSVFLRLNTGGQFGMIEDDLEYIILNQMKYSNVKIVGLHYFSGTQRKKTKLQEDDIKHIIRYTENLKNKYDFEFLNLEYGPGLSTPLFEDDDFYDTLKPIKDLRDILSINKISMDITIELGRFIVQECGYYITEVKEIKDAKQIKYCFIDGGINHINYIGSIMGIKIPKIEKITSNKSQNSYKEKYCICGSLCTYNDIIVRDIEIDSLVTGDILVFKNIGAYSVTEGIYLFLSRVMPKVVIRKSENEYIVARDFIQSYKLNM